MTRRREASRASWATKLGMTQVWDDDRVVPGDGGQGRAVRRDAGQDRRSATATPPSSSRFGTKRRAKVTKPHEGPLRQGRRRRRGRHLVELRIDDAPTLRSRPGDQADVFEAGDKVDVTGVTKGKGFAGVMKRHGFNGLGASHGNHTSTARPGSIGACATPGRVFKGMRMAGQHGQQSGSRR